MRNWNVRVWWRLGAVSERSYAPAISRLDRSVGRESELRDFADCVIAESWSSKVFRSMIHSPNSKRRKKELKNNALSPESLDTNSQWTGGCEPDPRTNVVSAVAFLSPLALGLLVSFLMWNLGGIIAGLIHRLARSAGT